MDGNGGGFADWDTAEPSQELDRTADEMFGAFGKERDDLQLRCFRHMQIDAQPVVAAAAGEIGHVIKPIMVKIGDRHSGQTRF